MCQKQPARSSARVASKARPGSLRHQVCLLPKFTVDFHQKNRLGDAFQNVFAWVPPQSVSLSKAGSEKASVGTSDSRFWPPKNYWLVRECNDFWFLRSRGGPTSHRSKDRAFPGVETACRAPPSTPRFLGAWLGHELQRPVGFGVVT